MTATQARTAISEMMTEAGKTVALLGTPTTTAKAARDLCRDYAISVKADANLAVSTATAYMNGTTPAPAPAPANTASVFVAGQGGSFTITTNTAIKFGNSSPNGFYQKTLVPGTYVCQSDFFGDPPGAIGQNKSCYTVGTDTTAPPQSPNRAGSTDDIPQTPVTTTPITTTPTIENNSVTFPTSQSIAQEGGVFTLTQPEIVKFGSASSGKMYQKLLGAGRYNCNLQFFGDPSVGDFKYCYIKQSGDAASATSPILDTKQVDGTPGGSTASYGGGNTTATGYLFDYIMCEGDSITAGTQNSPNPWPLQLQKLTGLTVYNYGISSTTLNQMKDNYGGNDHAGTKFVAGKRCALIIGSAGTNDFTQDNVTLQQLKDYIQVFAAKGRATGYKVYIGTLTPRQVSGAYTSSHDSIRLQYNDWLRSNYSGFADGIIDFAAVLTLSDMYDGIHPSDSPGSAKMAAAVKAAIAGSVTISTGFKPDVVVFEGDEITMLSGVGSTGFAGKWKALASNNPTILNIAREASQCRDVDDEYAMNDTANNAIGPGVVFVTGKTNALVFNIGGNDIANNNATVLSIINHYKSITSKAKATGYKVWLTTIMRRGDSGWDANKEAIRTGVNDWVRNNWATIADGRIDYESILPNSTNMSNGVLLTETGHGLAAQIINVAFGGSTAVVPVSSASSEITTNGAIDEAKWLAMAANMSTDVGMAYRYGAPSPTGQSLTTWYQPADNLWPAASYHSGWWQLGSYAEYDGQFIGGDFASNCIHVPYVADNPSERIGIAALQSTSTSHGTFSQKPELPWVYYGGGLDAAETLWWKTTQGKTVQNPTCSANALGRPGWAVTTITCFQNGFMATAGYNTMTNKASCQLAAGKVPTSICITSANELALVTVWDTINKRGEVAVVSLCGLGHGATIANPNSGQADGWWGEWNEPHPGLHNLGNLVFMKVLGYFALPGMMAPTDVVATTHHSRFGYLDGSPGEPSCGNQNFSNETIRQNWLPGKSLERAYAKQGEAIVISKTEKKAIFLNLKPLFDYMNSMYFSSDRNKYLQTTNIGQNAGQWPFTFTEAPAQIPTVTKTLTFDDEPTCLFIAPYSYKEEWRQALIGFKGGTMRIFNTGGTADTGNAAVKVEVASFNVGANPTSVSWIKEKARGSQKELVPEHTRQFVVNVRGERAIKWYDLTSTTAASLRRTFQDSRIIDPIKTVDTDNHGGEHYLVNVIDYSGKKVHGVRWGKVILWTYASQVFNMGANGTAAFEYGGSFTLPGKPFNGTTANVS